MKEGFIQWKNLIPANTVQNLLAIQVILQNTREFIQEKGLIPANTVTKHLVNVATVLGKISYCNDSFL